MAGTYYENYVLTEAGFIPVSIVFFQDDAELADLRHERVDPNGLLRSTRVYAKVK